jgi:LuxR family maltose regulon positive regulatory protein
MVSPFPLGQLQQERGRLTAALRTHRESLRLATGGARTSAYHAGLAHLGIAQVLYERNQLDDALQHLRDGSELGRQERWFREHERVAAAWLHQASGEADSALAAMNEACRLQASPRVSSLWYPARSERARLFLAQGQTGEAERWTEERGLTDNDEVSYVRERDHLVLARVLLARSDPDRVLRLLERLDQLAESQDRTASLIQIRAVRSLALQAAGDHRGALTMLVDALARGAPEGYLRVFVDEGGPMATLLGKLSTTPATAQAKAAAHVPPAYLGRLLEAFEQAGQAVLPVPRRGAALPGLVAPLSARELEVLGLLAAGRSNQAIAEELVITLDTVKRHVTHILDKLGAANRTQAVTQARELGLLR